MAKRRDIQALPRTRAGRADPTRRSRAQRLQPAHMALNLTAMIDVIFLLLIYFVITASFVEGEGVIASDLSNGRGEHLLPPPPPVGPLAIEVRVEGRYGYQLHVGPTATPVRDFAQLARLLAEWQYDPTRNRQGPYPPDTPVVIKPDRTVRWQHVVDTINAVVKARFQNYALLAVHPKRQAP